MVLDITNMTNQELELKYTATKSILIEENESCRIPIPVERCPLSKIGKVNKSVLKLIANNEKNYNMNVFMFIVAIKTFCVLVL